MTEDAYQKYKINFTAGPELDYQDGFADGYSRAWQECWEYFRTNFIKDAPKEETARAEEGE